MKSIILDSTAAATEAALEPIFELSPINLLIIVTLVLFVILFVGALAVLKSLKTLVRVTMPELEEEQKAQIASKLEKKRDRRAWWNKVAGLNPMETEEEIMIDHEYDGIRELDNPTPLWFNALFYSTIVFAIGYILVYDVFGWGMNQEEEYLAQMELAEAERLAYLEASGSNVDENSVTVDLSPEFVAAGQEIYLLNCGMCHGNQGEGMIGPNLTDDFWIHGGEVGDIFRTIKYGVPDKGMVPWEANLTPVQIAQVANYIVSIVGTNPPNAKPAEGEKMEGRASDAAGEASAETEETVEETSTAQETSI
ncbi:cbb3-type cytochrome c oxidase N-terminal domain-containing protein [Albibacterium profundi]|uniref:Cbb3-type cytochrome c oxidase N-terminal domain-containing protein n=1 Tax=Albibacterium profundi TaxID=3134906 RepID=A0ABV5CAL3_9SPHI